jgi:hypothetical protein
VKVLVAFLLVIFVLACRPGDRGPRPRNVALCFGTVLVAAMLYQYRFV